jgi:HD-GYP domain-containing protein (c-di-GMP phosphodiesterase class II)
VRAGAGELNPATARPQRLEEVMSLCARAVADKVVPEGLRVGAMIAPLVLHDKPAGFIYLEASEELSQNDRALIQVMANQCSAALENFHLHIDLRTSYEQAIETLGQVAEFKDSTTGMHIRRLADYTTVLAEALGVPHAQAVEFGRAALLHDVGKVGVPDAILQKPGKLTPEEFEVVKRHTDFGSTILSHDAAFAMAREVALGHHERWDGTGYPNGLAGETIPLVTRIVAVADVFDALVSERPYKSAWAPAEAILEIEANAGTQFDPAVVAVLVELYREGKLDPILYPA